MNPLPIDPFLPEIVTRLTKSHALVLSAPPGAGKTTRVPCALFDAGFAEHGEILVLEPRRLAARLAAFWVAQELGEKPGRTVGYSIRFESVGGPQTRIRFLTEAILSRRIVQDPNLYGVSTVILDEFHERHIASDLALALLKQLQKRNPKLKILVMSATLDAGPVASFLSDAPLMSIEGSPFDVQIEYEERPVSRPIHEKAASAVSKLVRSGAGGDILVFLPGSAEIRRAAELLEPLSGRLGFLLLPLHGDLPSSQQRRAIEPAGKLKVILATNVAETSITIPGIAAVIDSGLARVAGHSAWSGFPTLTTAKISKSSAAQRAGRAGRTRAGHVVRLYTRPDFQSRPGHDIPEIKRTDLAESVLMLHGAGYHDTRSFAWFDPPEISAIEAAETLLAQLGAIGNGGRITGAGVRMLQLPVHPRLARLILEGEKMGIAEEGALLAALISERDIRLDVRTSFGVSRAKTRPDVSARSDLLDLMDRFREAEQANFGPEHVLALGLDLHAVEAVRRAQRQLCRILSGRNRPAPPPSPAEGAEEALLIAVLAAFPDRVAKRRKAGSRELLLSGGGSAVLSPGSVVRETEFLVAVDAEERKEKDALKAPGTIVRLASGIEIEWLAGLFPESITQKTELMWNERAGRVDELRQTSYLQIAIEEAVKTATPSEEASRILASQVLARGLTTFHDFSSLPAFRARLSLAAGHFPTEKLPEISDDEIRRTVEKLCYAKRSLEELADLSLVAALMSTLTGRQRNLLEREAPERVKLKRGRSARVHYESGKPPWIESRIQDFFGQISAPKICAGRETLTVHLLAPNGRAVQVTQDLAGFWERHYPAIRRELMRRYPKHAWPEEVISD
jgi:ATP-dependent helicase HrpB